MGNQVLQCSECGNNYERKDNQIYCPICKHLIRLGDLQITDLATGLQYILLSRGSDTLRQGDQTANILSDIIRNSDKEVQFIRTMYRIAESEMGSFIMSASMNYDPKNEIEKLIRALHKYYLDPDWIDRIITAYLRCFNLDADTLLGANHLLAKNNCFPFHTDKLAEAIRELYKKQGIKLWKNDCAESIIAVDPTLENECRMIGFCEKARGQPLYDLMKQLSSPNYHAGQTLQEEAQLRISLKASFMSTQAIDGLLEAIHKASGTVQQRHPKPKPQPTNTSSVNVTTMNTSKIPSSNEGSSDASPSQANTSTVNTQSKQKNTQVPPENQFQNARCIKAAAAITLVFLTVVTVKYIIPFFPPSGTQTPVTATSSPIETPALQAALSTPKATENPYSAPIISGKTSISENGRYSTMLQIPFFRTDLFRSYQGPTKTFYFKYPVDGYDEIDYSFQNEGEDIDICFYCNNDPSSLTVTCHPLPEGYNSETYRDYLMEKANEELSDVIIVSQKQRISMSGNWYNANDSSAWAGSFYIKGTRAADNTIEHRIYDINNGNVETMIITMSKPLDTLDRACKDYYAHVMYSYCKFGGDIEPTYWNSFKEKYGF